MTSFRQFEANERNSLRSTGPKSDEGKRRSRLNAVRHGLTAETVVASLEDAEDYRQFEAAIIADYCAETTVARELVLRLASLLWRLRRANAIEAALLEIQAQALRERQMRGKPTNRVKILDNEPPPIDNDPICDRQEDSGKEEYQTDDSDKVDRRFAWTTRQLAYCFLRLANLDSGVFERLNRYEAALWRQAAQIIFSLHPIKQR